MQDKTPIKLCRGAITDIQRRTHYSRMTIYAALRYHEPDTLIKRDIRRIAMSPKYLLTPKEQQQ